VKFERPNSETTYRGSRRRWMPGLLVPHVFHFKKGTAATAAKQLESVKNLVWRRNVEEARDRLTNLRSNVAHYGCSPAA
jgi:hypothetical protein